MYFPSKDKVIVMEDFVDHIFRGSEVDEPELIKAAFRKKFEKAVNVEWYHRANHFEAIFYIDTIEYIALFDLQGELIEYKMFLSLDYLPSTIRAKIEEKGEIMNVVLINKGNKILYEAIIREEKKIRKVIIMSNLGKTLEEKGL